MKVDKLILWALASRSVNWVAVSLRHFVISSADMAAWPMPMRIVVSKRELMRILSISSSRVMLGFPFLMAK
jgi:hypothetical protein